MKGTYQANKISRTGWVPLLRLTGAVVAVGALSSSIAAGGAAGAATSSVVSTSKNTQYGTILVSGNTVYTLKASKVACKAACLKIWPPVMLPTGVAKATAGPGVNASRLGTVKRSGDRQVTYGGKALYYFIGDGGPGQVKGNLTDTWGKWSVVVTVKPAHPSTGSGGTKTTNAGSGGVSF